MLHDVHAPKRRRAGVWIATATALSLSFVAQRAFTAPEASAPAAAPAALHERVDALLEANQVAIPAGPAADHEFFRRVMLDLCGMIPTAAETRAFIADGAPDKRAKLVARLLQSPEHARRMAVWLDVTFMERRADKAVTTAEWRDYLYESVLANKPYDQLAREILTSDGTDPKLRAAAKFFLDRDAEPNLMTRDVARIFFGRDYQCCQCHDHPIVDDYYQSDYYGIYSLVSRTSLFVDPKDKKTYLAETAEGDPGYVSVFDKARVPRTSHPQIPEDAPFAEPAIAKGEEYQVKPAPNVRPIPKLSRRAELAERATRGNRAFQKNIVNRVWAMLMGRGLVDPVDMQHRGNPPLNAAVLDLLADEFAAHHYDLRWLIGELVMTRAYQRSIDTPAQLIARAGPAAATMASEQPEYDRRIAAAAKAKEAVNAATDQLEAQRVAAAAMNVELAKHQTTLAAAKKSADTATAAVAAAQKDLTAKQETARLLADAAAKAAQAAARAAGNQAIASAAAQLKTQHDQFAAQAAAAQTALASQQAALKTAADTQHAAEAGIATVTEQFKAATARIDAIAQQQKDARVVWLAADADADRVAARIADAQAIVNLAKASQAAGAMDGELAKSAAALAAARQSASAATMAQQTAAAARDAAQQATTNAAGAMSHSQAELAERKATAAALAEALSKTKLAAERLPGDVELVAVTTKLKARLDQTNAEAAEMQPRIDELAAAAKVAADGLRAAAQSADVAKAEADRQAAAAKQVEAAHAALVAKQDAAASECSDCQKALADRTARRLLTANLRALSPEQLAWSMMQATGVVAQQRASIAAARAAAPIPYAPDPELTPDQASARAAFANRTAETLLNERLSPSAAPFITLFAAAAGQPQNEFYATADQALFFSNGGHVRGWLAPSGDNLTGRLMKLTDARACADELYFSVFNRPATEAETADVAAYLKPRTADRSAAIGEVIWSLLTSAEFRFNH
jgi:hypothetical protein